MTYANKFLYVGPYLRLPPYFITVNREVSRCSNSSCFNFLSTWMMTPFCPQCGHKVEKLKLDTQEREPAEVPSKWLEERLVPLPYTLGKETPVFLVPHGRRAYREFNLCLMSERDFVNVFSGGKDYRTEDLAWFGETFKDDVEKLKPKYGGSISWGCLTNI